MLTTVAVTRFTTGSPRRLLPLALLLQLRQFAVGTAATRVTPLLRLDNRIVRATYGKDGSDNAQGYQRNDDYQQKTHLPKLSIYNLTIYNLTIYNLTIDLQFDN